MRASLFRDEASLDPRTIICRIYVQHLIMLQHIMYCNQALGLVVSEKRIRLVTCPAPIISLWQLMAPPRHGLLGPKGHI